MFLFAKVGVACSCVNMSIDEKRQKADAIFTGKVIAITDSEIKDHSEVKFRIIKSLKSVNETEVMVITDKETWSCHYPFSVGGVYTVQAREQAGKLYTNRCSGNSAEQVTDSAEQNPSVNKAESVRAASGHNSGSFKLLLLAGLFAAFILLAVVITWRVRFH